MNPKISDFQQVVLDSAEVTLFQQRRTASDEASLNKAYHDFLKSEKERIKKAHQEGTSGLDVATWRAALLDVVLNDYYAMTCQKEGPPPFILVASGGYGRGLLNPGSDIDLQFILPKRLSDRKAGGLKTLIHRLLTMLYDAGFSVGHGVRSFDEAITFANQDHPTKTALLDARYIAGDAAKFYEFEATFFKKCIIGKEIQYLTERCEDNRARHRKYGCTPHRQEPHVKMGCGGLRDYHNIIWLIWVLQKSRDLNVLVDNKKLSYLAYTEIEAAYEFLMRVRNELHYIQSGQTGDIMTLRHQGIIATHFEYPGKTIIQRSEHFMKDYYRHTKALYRHGGSVMQAYNLEVEPPASSPIPIISALAARFHRSSEVAEFEGFFAKDGLIFPGLPDPFAGNSRQLIRFFLHTQQRGLKTSPEIRNLFEIHWDDIDDAFRSSWPNRETFEQILQTRGQVAQILRQMHRVGFLGRYLPEFGHLTDLVQHEFFHQYTADEHTLRCIDELDRILLSEEPKEQFFKKIFQNFQDPVALYIALIMHDTGRAENVRVHEDASAILAAKVCERLKYSGDRLRLIMFLVDHHLSFWRTATTKDLSDQATIADFAATVKNKTFMEALYLFTYVDSRGTNDAAWNDWKASLMQQLYRSTCSYFDDREAFEEQFNTPLEKTKERVFEELEAPESYHDEIEAHFNNLPERYFNYRGAASIARHIKLFRSFFTCLTRDGAESLQPIFRWEPRHDEGYTLLEVVSWNRNGLLAIIAGALASRNLNVLSADIFMREDDLVLDIFRVCTTNFQPIPTHEIIQLEKLISEACSADENSPVNFPKLIEQCSQPSILDDPKPDYTIPQRAFVNNDQSETATVLEIQAADRIGLLYDIFNALNQLDTNILSARISTQAGAAIDRFYLVDTLTESKITDPKKLEAIEYQVWLCMAVAERV